MFKNILLIRYLFLVAVVFTFINSMFFMYGGVLECIKGYKLILAEGMSEELKPGLHLLRGLELFLVSMVTLIFSLGMLRLFIVYHTNDEHVPSWLKLESFKELKVLLWETILVTLVVFTLTKVASDMEILTWDALILPGVILALTGSLFLMKKS